MIVSFYLHSLEALDQLALQVPKIQWIKLKVVFNHNCYKFNVHDHEV